MVSQQTAKNQSRAPGMEVAGHDRDARLRIGIHELFQSAGLVPCTVDGARQLLNRVNGNSATQQHLALNFMLAKNPPIGIGR